MSVQSQAYPGMYPNSYPANGYPANSYPKSSPLTAGTTGYSPMGTGGFVDPSNPYNPYPSRSTGDVCCESRDSGYDMQHVGYGYGDHVLRSNYEYVGQGAGEFTPVVRQNYGRRQWCYGLLCGALCLVLCVPLLWQFMGSSSSLSSTPIAAPLGSNPTAVVSAKPVEPRPSRPPTPFGHCLIWGDPHIVPFDMKDFDTSIPTNFLTNGDFWLVNTRDIWIQGRYMSDEWTNGFASLHSIAVGGPFLDGSRVVIEGTSSKIWYDDKEILGSAPSEFNTEDGRVKAWRGTWKVKLDDNTQKQVDTVILELPGYVRVVVTRWETHIDAMIGLHQVPGQDGYCGNFNGKPEDDSDTAINKRGNWQVSSSHSLLKPAAFNTETTRQLGLEDCHVSTRRKGLEACASKYSGANEAVLAACVYDYCFSGQRYATEDAASLKAMLSLLHDSDLDDLEKAR